MPIEQKLNLMFLFRTSDNLHSYRNPGVSVTMSAVDQEGGMVARIQTPQIDSTPQSEIQTAAQASKIALNRAQILKSYNINTNFAPVVEVIRDNNSYLANLNRAFPGDEQQVYQLAKAMIQTYQQNGIIAVAKHFPGGLGRKSADPHQTLPTININRQQLNQDLIPFQKLIQDNQIKALMTTHILYPQIDSQNPVTTSEIFISQILRGDLNYQGVILSDDLTMKGISSSKTVEQIAIQAIQAGHDIILIAGPETLQQSAYQTLLKAVQRGEISEKRINQSVKRILLLQYLIT